MKVGTISLNINAPDFNYGAILHSWAFQKYLKTLDIVTSTEIVDYTMPKLEGQNLQYPFIEDLKGMHIRKCLHDLKVWKLYQSRYYKFQSFIKAEMQISKTKYVQKTLESAELNYDCIICESDVIWSPGFSGGHFDRTFFLALKSMSNMKRIAYAPSMADGDLTKIQEDELKKLLVYPQYISCRESYEKNILEKYTNKHVTHVMDPVFLMDKEDYNSICEKKMINREYILLYLPVDDNAALRKHALEYARLHDLKILEICTNLKSYEVDDITCIGDASIGEFLSAIKYAEMVFTNSFHAICFSIIFNTQFYAFSRAYAGKVKDICATFDLQERYFADDFFCERKPIDYSTVNVIREDLIKKSKNWLMSALLKDNKDSQ